MALAKRILYLAKAIDCFSIRWLKPPAIEENCLLMGIEEFAGAAVF